MALNSVKLIKLLRTSCEEIIKNADYLNELDAVMGDGEHGSNMKKCFSAINDKLDGWTNLQVYEILQQTGMTLLSSGGGTATTLLGFAFTKASNKAKEFDVLDSKSIASVWKTAYESLKAKSKAQLGDKTLLDALEPATDVFVQAVESGSAAKDALEAASKAAKEGAEKTKTMIAKKGRGLYVGERGLETPDPGATSISIIIKAWKDAI